MVVKEQGSGLKISHLCRKHGIGDATFYKWKSRYGDREVSEAKRLKALEDEGGMIGRSQRVDQSLVNAAG
ncbi:transposase [Komagataeibacter oboediens DSM 11826]|nr:transposase [Komagataeibacter oboediens DSM 11826]